MAERNDDNEENSGRNDEGETVFPRDSMDISDQIGRALELYSPFILRKLNETLEGAMSSNIATMIRDEVAVAVQAEFIKRDSMGKEDDVREKVTETGEVSQKTRFTYKDFSICKPLEFHGEVDPIICTRWVSEIEGTFRTSQCPEELKVTYAVSMLRDHAKRWWDSLLTVKKEELNGLTWPEFKAMFFKEFRSVAEVTRLRGEFLNDCQESSTINEFRVKFLDKAQFCPEFLESDTLLKEHFYRKLKKSIREKISLRQMESFSMLVDVARDHEIEQMQSVDETSKRKFETYNSPSKRAKQEDSSGGNTTRKDLPFCNQCRRNHSGVCKAGTQGCFTCGKFGHMSKDCRSNPTKPIVCFKCFQEGHMRSSCPMLNDEEKREERRKEAERINARAMGSQRGRSFQLTAEETKETMM